METIPYFLIFLLVIFSIWTFLGIQKHQNMDSKKVKFIEIEIQKEREKALQLENVASKIIDFEKNTNQQFLKVNVAVFNLDFTLKEIF